MDWLVEASKQTQNLERSNYKNKTIILGCGDLPLTLNRKIIAQRDV